MGSIRAADAMLPALAADFGRAPSDTAAVITAFALAYGLMQLVWGPLGDRIGKLRVIGWAAMCLPVARPKACGSNASTRGPANGLT